MQHLIIFASGRGSNAESIIDFFRNEGGARVVLIVTNKRDAGVIDLAQREQIPVRIVSRTEMEQPAFVAGLQQLQPSLIVLAGFLLKIPPALISAFPIVNIHPALLPAFGGKGMWGTHVHTAVLAAGERQSGISIHMVDEEYDRGATVLQARCPVLPEDTAVSLAARVLRLEHFWYPRAIQFLLAEGH